MKRLLLIVIIPWWSASAALPTLSQLAEELSGIRERLAAATNATASLEARLSALTNLNAKLEGIYNATKSGRAQWHGGAPSYRYDTNTVGGIIRLLETYPDGFTFEEPGRARRIPAPEEAAEHAALVRDAHPRRIEALRQSIARWDALGAATPTNDQQVIDAARARINAARARKTLQRLEALSQTNEVSVAVAPSEGSAK